MAFAKNGAAIIGGVVVPASEMKVLTALVEMGRPATVPEIAMAMHNSMSDASLYSLLGRLNEQRRLVARQVVEVEVLGTKLRRVQWTAHQAAIGFLANTENLYGDSKSEKAQEPAGAAG
ncbi:hypothetical protein [uncultured Hydrogenophaga sp.]|uniref:hypothetical protein n=1 Tax=uncultured Hydrogenophaga sp. TaxID=199683 RepID=UPI002590CB78|nr:hypothetical protein [uncultured Hydrogenophaga sp.]